MMTMIMMRIVVLCQAVAVAVVALFEMIGGLCWLLLLLVVVVGCEAMK
jgi:hypothetical protein